MNLPGSRPPQPTRTCGTPPRNKLPLTQPRNPDSLSSRAHHLRGAAAPKASRRLCAWGLLRGLRRTAHKKRRVSPALWLLTSLLCCLFSRLFPQISRQILRLHRAQLNARVHLLLPVLQNALCPRHVLLRKKPLRIVSQLCVAEHARHLRQPNRCRRIHLFQNGREVIFEQLPRGRLRFVILQHRPECKHVLVLHLVAQQQVKRLPGQFRFGKGAQRKKIVVVLLRCFCRLHMLHVLFIERSIPIPRSHHQGFTRQSRIHRIRQTHILLRRRPCLFHELRIPSSPRQRFKDIGAQRLPLRRFSRHRGRPQVFRHRLQEIPDPFFVGFAIRRIRDSIMNLRKMVNHRLHDFARAFSLHLLEQVQVVPYLHPTYSHERPRVARDPHALFRRKCRLHVRAHLSECCRLVAAAVIPLPARVCIHPGRTSRQCHRARFLRQQVIGRLLRRRRQQLYRDHPGFVKARRHPCRIRHVPLLFQGHFRFVALARGAHAHQRRTRLLGEALHDLVRRLPAVFVIWFQKSSAVAFAYACFSTYAFTPFWNSSDPT